MIRTSMRGTALAALVTLPFLGFTANAQIAVSANDNKIALVDGVNTVPANPAPDTVTILDIGVSPPKVLGELNAPSSVVGVPQSVAVSKDESFALVTAAMKVDPADPKKTAPDDKVSVIDLKASPPAVIATLQAGAGVTGISINPAGTLAIAANRSEGTLSVFTISGKTLTPAGKIDLGNKGSGPSHVAFLPDGKSRDRDARRRSPRVDPVDRRHQGRGHQEVHGRRFPPLQPRHQPEGRCRRVRQSGRRAGRFRPDQRHRSEEQSAAHRRSDLGRPDSGRRFDGAGRLARRRDPAQRLAAQRRTTRPTTITA